MGTTVHSKHFSAGDKEKAAAARRIYCQPCCRENCLMKLGLGAATPLIIGCMAEVENLSAKEKRQYLLDKLSHSAVKKSNVYIKVFYYISPPT